PEVTTGGRALKFYASMRIDVRRIEQIKNTKGEMIGSRTRAKIVKNKVAPPFKTAEFDIMYGTGIAKEGEILDAATSLGIIQKSGAWYSYNEERLGQGRDNVKAYLLANPDFMAGVENQIRERQAELAEQAKPAYRGGARHDEADGDGAPAPAEAPTTAASAKAKLDITVDDED
ncbi:MAG: DNA recombination/repair protein RecA, partial [Clostridia bacterium]|nr:DNA recombination/repair protein RecA [Clostridia bacterium]